MPVETRQAVAWALNQEWDGEPVTTDSRHALVHLVREYFNENNIPYNTFSASDLDPYLPPTAH